jgi:predicted transcriptional regulator YdeE
VYTAYESDHTGEYSLVVGAAVHSAADVPDALVSVILPSATYLVFTAEGPMPDALIRTWMDIWRYFSDNVQYRRAYTADFERYDKREPARVDVYVALL